MADAQERGMTHESGSLYVEAHSKIQCFLGWGPIAPTCDDSTKSTHDDKQTASRKADNNMGCSADLPSAILNGYLVTGCCQNCSENSAGISDLSLNHDPFLIPGRVQVLQWFILKMSTYGLSNEAHLSAHVLFAGGSLCASCQRQPSLLPLLPRPVGVA